MKIHRFLLVTILMCILIIGFLYYQVRSISQHAETTSIPPEIAVADCTPTFADGGGPYYQEGSPFRMKIVPDQNNGEQLVISGKVLRRDCKTPVANAVLDIWQANETGSYQDEWYRGKVVSDQEGNYSFETVVPKGYGEGTGYRPPHIHFKVFVDNVEIITSQMFFPEAIGRPGFNDAYIMRLKTHMNEGKRNHTGNHNIILP